MFERQVITSHMKIKKRHRNGFTRSNKLTSFNLTDCLDLLEIKIENSLKFPSSSR